MSGRQSGSMSRRALLGWGLVAATAPFAGVRLRAGPDLSEPSSAPPAPSVAPAESLVGAFGVVTHLSFHSTVYDQTNRVVDAVAQLGVRHVRDRIVADDAVRAGFRAMVSNGIQIEGVCGAFGRPQTMREVMDEVVRSYRDPTVTFAAFEGMNEPNNNGTPWVEITRAATKNLFDERAAHDLTTVQIVGPALASVDHGRVAYQDPGDLGDLTPWIDRGNIHVYPKGNIPSTGLDRFLSLQRAVCGDKPIYSTEGGYFTGLNYQGGSNPTPDDVVRQYVPRELMENWIRGVKRFFLYELLDDPDPTNANRESNWGMLRVGGLSPAAPWTPKPHFYAMKNLLAILGDPGPPHPVSSLEHRIDGGGSDLRSALVQKRDGAHYLCIWRDVSVYDPQSRKVIAADADMVRVVLARPADVAVYAPSTADTVQSSQRGAREFRLSVAGELLICRIS